MMGLSLNVSGRQSSVQSFSIDYYGTIVRLMCSASVRLCVPLR